MKVEWTRAARTDLIEIFDYILQENPGAAADVLDKIEHTAAHLATHPGMGRPGRVEHTRELIIPGFPWILPYLNGPNTVTFVRVMHSAMQWPGSFEEVAK